LLTVEGINSRGKEPVCAKHQTTYYKFAKT